MSRSINLYELYVFLPIIQQAAKTHITLSVLHLGLLLLDHGGRGVRLPCR